MHLPLRVRVACAAVTLFALAGCLLEPSSERFPDRTQVVPPGDEQPDTIPPPPPPPDTTVTDPDTTIVEPPPPPPPPPPPDTTVTDPDTTIVEPPPPPPPPPPPGDVENGLLSDLTSLGTLYAPTDNWWNLRVDSAPLDPNSSQIIQLVASYESTGGRMHPDFTPNYGIPYCVVDQNTPLVPVSFGNTSESDAGYPGGPTGYPIPVEATTNLRYIENAGGTDGDRHLIIYDRDKRAAFELSYASYSSGRWSAGYGAVFKLDSNYRRPEGWTSTDAAGLCVLAGLVRYDEVFGPDPIRHAIRCSIKRTNRYVWPASHTGATDAGAPPLGMRFRLKASVDISGYPPEIRKIFQAMKDYGLIVADRGGNMYVQGTMDSRWDNGVLNPAFHSLHVTDFEVIKLGWKP